MQITGDIKVAMVTGHHEYDVVDFQRMLREIPDIDFYPQHLEDFAIDTEEARGRYEVIAFYNYQQQTPSQDGDELGRVVKGPLEKLGETGQGIVMMHHALTAYPSWPYWLDICGMGDTTRPLRPGPESRTDQNLVIEIADPGHPITRGMTSWEMVDETYNFEDAREGSHVLLTTEHPESMRTIAWTRQHRHSRVFCLQSGHDNQTYADPHYREMVERGIKWAASTL